MVMDEGRGVRNVRNEGCFTCASNLMAAGTATVSALQQVQDYNIRLDL